MMVGPGYLLPGWRSEAEPQEAKASREPRRFLSRHGGIARTTQTECDGYPETFATLPSTKNRHRYFQNYPPLALNGSPGLPRVLKPPRPSELSWLPGLSSPPGAD